MFDECIREIQADLRSNFREARFSAKFLNELGDAFVLFGPEETLRRLDASRARGRKDKEFGKTIIKALQASPEIERSPEIGRLIIKSFDAWRIQR